jgi:hypothetical protein
MKSGQQKSFTLSTAEAPELVSGTQCLQDMLFLHDVGDGINRAEGEEANDPTN